MADPSPVQVNNTLKAVLAIATLLFNAGIIAYLIWKGDGTNSLHTSALGWAAVTNGGIMVGLGIGAVTPAIVEAWKGVGPKQG